MNDDELEPSRLLARPPRRRIAPWMIALPAAALLGGLALVIRARAPKAPLQAEGLARTREGGSSPENEFASRGPMMRVVEVACAPAPCRSGSQMHVRLNTPADQPNAGLFSQASDGTIFWYLPAPGGHTSTPPRGQWLPDAVVLGEEHRPGKYTLYVALSAVPLSREELKAELATGLSSTPNVKLVKSTLRVETGP